MIDLGCTCIKRQETNYYVAPSGSDAPANGRAAAPWATIAYAITRVPDGATILVAPGTYTGQVRLDASFAQGVTVRAEPPYQARLRHNATVVIVYNGQGITLDGFDIAHSGPGAGALLMQVQNLRSQGVTSRITIRNNLFHDSYNNDLLKINNGATDILVAGNMFYNQTGSDEHIDVNSVTNVVLQDNIFLNDFAGSGRTNSEDTSAFVVVKDSNGNDDGLLGSRDILLRRNVFLNWQGGTGHGFIQIGEDATANFEAERVMIENNLLLGNSSDPMRAPFALMGVRDVTIRHNTVVGDLPVTTGFAMRLYRVGANQPNANIRFANNIFSDPTGTMGFFAGAPIGQTASFALERNLAWNNGQPIPSSTNSMVNLADDSNRIIGDPQLGTQADLIVPRWNPSTNQFADGSATIRAAFENLVARYGTPGETSAALESATPTDAPADDILGNPRPRGTGHDIGAVELQRGTAPPPRSPRQFLPVLRKR